MGKPQYTAAVDQHQTTGGQSERACPLDIISARTLRLIDILTEIMSRTGDKCAFTICSDGPKLPRKNPRLEPEPREDGEQQKQRTESKF